eukprot:RCo028264
MTPRVAGMVVVTVLSNLAGLPAAAVLYRQRNMDFELFLCLGTFVTSMCYHLCESLGTSLWLTEVQWHRLDNVMAISSFMCWFVYLCDFTDRRARDACRFAVMAVVLVLQEGAPWDERFTFGPVLATALLFLLKRWLVDGCGPKCDPNRLRTGLLLQSLGVLCFIRGLDNDTDPLRIFHGLWHVFISGACYFLWDIVQPQATAVARGHSGGHLGTSLSGGTHVTPCRDPRAGGC